MSSVIYVPRVFGGVVILHVAAPAVSTPGLVAISDQAHGSASVSDVLVDQVAAEDAEIGVATISDQA